MFETCQYLTQTAINDECVTACYNKAVRQRRDYKEKPKEAKPLTSGLASLYFQ